VGAPDAPWHAVRIAPTSIDSPLAGAPIDDICNRAAAAGDAAALAAAARRAAAFLASLA
jgi:hypothetical protein